MLSKTSATTASVITAPARLLLRLIKKDTGEVDSAIYTLALLQGYSTGNARWLAKQFRHETAHGTSYSFKNDLNAWGMNKVNVRPTTQTGSRPVGGSQAILNTGEVLGVYPSLWASVVDRFWWDSYWGLDAFKRSTDYPERVGEIYHASPSYSANVSAVNPSGYTTAVAVTWMMLPLEIFAIQKIWEYFKN